MYTCVHIYIYIYYVYIYVYIYIYIYIYVDASAANPSTHSSQPLATLISLRLTFRFLTHTPMRVIGRQQEKGR